MSKTERSNIQEVVIIWEYQITFHVAVGVHAVAVAFSV